MITSKIPNNWQNLQSKVAQILNESGIIAEITKKVKTVRGEIEIDVFAREQFDNRNYDIIIEYKRWRTNIPQTIVHGFRTVISDIGANIGYIIALNGFQSGAYEARKCTNVNIITWEEFQTLFEERWLKNYFSDYIENKFRALISYTEPLVPTWALKLNDEDTEKMKALYNKYDELGLFLLSLKKDKLGIFVNTEDVFPKLPLDKNRYNNIQKELSGIIGYRELLDVLHKYCDPAIEEFRELEKKVV